MKQILWVSFFLFCSICFSRSALAQPDYALSPDGNAVMRITPSESIPGNSFDNGLLNSYGNTATTASGGALSVTSYNAGSCLVQAAHISRPYTTMVPH